MVSLPRVVEQSHKSRLQGARLDRRTQEHLGQRRDGVLCCLLQEEELHPGGRPATRAEARQRLFGYIWAYNIRRRPFLTRLRHPGDYAAATPYP